MTWPVSLNMPVQGALHLLPDRIAVRLDDHAAADVGVLGQPGTLHDVEVPLGIVAARVVIFSAMVSSPCLEKRDYTQSPRIETMD